MRALCLCALTRDSSPFLHYEAPHACSVSGGRIQKALLRARMQACALPRLRPHIEYFQYFYGNVTSCCVRRLPPVILPSCRLRIWAIPYYSGPLLFDTELLVRACNHRQTAFWTPIWRGKYLLGKRRSRTANVRFSWSSL